MKTTAKELIRAINQKHEKLIVGNGYLGIHLVTAPNVRIFMTPAFWEAAAKATSVMTTRLEVKRHGRTILKTGDARKAIAKYNEMVDAGKSGWTPR